MDSGNMHYFVGADTSCISWGHAQNGELGYGPNGQKSSAIPKKVDILEGMHVIGVACGMGHSMVIVDRANIGDRLDELDIYDGKAAAEEGSEEPKNKTPLAKQTSSKKAAKATGKRNKSKEDSASEDEAEGDDNSDNSDQENGQSNPKRRRGGKASSRGRGGAKTGGKSAGRSQAKPGKRGRPRKL